MKVPYSWLTELVPDAPGVRETEELLTLSGTKVEAVHQFGVPGADNGGASGYKVGRVASFEQHPNADRLRLCRVDVGEGEPRQIVCGASNFQEGDTVAVVLPGATLPGGDVLGKAKLRGVESHGMMLSERELELSQDHSGIMILPSDWSVGASLGEYLPLGDTVIELELTPNRPDCLGVVGVARELAAAAELELKVDLESDATPEASGAVEDHVTVKLEAEDLCARYMARAFVDVQVGVSPPWMRARLSAAGMRPINNVVDVTNYVMLATGQPLHAFDTDKLEGGTIIVRRARDGEQVTTLDGVERKLTTNMLSIAGAESTAVIAGVMGAADVEVGEGTTRIVLEAACFDGPTIMRTSTALGLRSESSARFEKGLDPYLPEVALRMASRLFVELCGAKLVPGTIDCIAGGNLEDPPVVPLSVSLPGEVLGMDVDADTSKAILTRLGYECTSAAIAEPPGWSVRVPHWRMYDTTRSIDLVEEIGRINGLDKLPATLPARGSAIGGLTRGQRLQRLLEDAAASLGLHETVTYSLVPEGYNVSFGLPADGTVTLNNPMTNDHVELRATTVGSQLDVVRHNQAAGFENVALFEMSRNFHTGDEGSTLPTWAREDRVMAICCVGELWGGRYDLPGVSADLPAIVGLAQSLVGAAGARLDSRPPATVPAWLHPGLAAELVVGDTVVGWAGVLHPSLAADRDIRGEVVAAELQLHALENALPQLHRFSPISTFPPVRQDIALVVAGDTPASAVLDLVREHGGDLLESVVVFDRYEGEQVEQGHYSLALRMVFRADDRTLTDDEVAEVRNRVTAQLTESLGARLRDA